MADNQLWALICLICGACYIVLSAVFALLKEKGAMLISGFNTMSKEKRELYDKRMMCEDMRNLLLLWAVILFAGGVLSYFISYFFAIGAMAVWAVIFFRNIKFDAEKAFAKYLK